MTDKLSRNLFESVRVCLGRITLPCFDHLQVEILNEKKLYNFVTFDTQKNAFLKFKKLEKNLQKISNNFFKQIFDKRGQSFFVPSSKHETQKIQTMQTWSIDRESLDQIRTILIWVFFCSANCQIKLAILWILFNLCDEISETCFKQKF